MAALRDAREGALQASFGLGLMMLLLLPSEVGYQDLAALVARVPGTDRVQKAAITSLLGPTHETRLDIPQPLGTARPSTLGYTLVGLDPSAAEITGSIRERVLGEAIAAGRVGAPMMDRSAKGDYGVFGGGERKVALKGDRLRQRPQGEPDAAAPAPESAGAGGYSLASAGDYRVAAPSHEDSPPPRRQRRGTDAVADLQPDPAGRSTELFFGAGPLGQRLGALVPWAPGQEPKLDEPSRDVKLAALPSEAFPGGIIDAPIDRADPTSPGVVTKDAPGGETVARKGQVTGAGQRPMTPAERLGLDQATRPREEKCLADAIYFEARGEQVRGQMAVAQVVLNRAFSGKYPSTVCGVVYQNAHRRLACQFTFACDGIPDVIREPDMWERAKVIAAEMLDGKLWLPEVGKATHYHAYWVRPGWVREMNRMHKLGVHTFYRPRKWGDGGEEPQWGDEETTAESAKKLVEAARKL
ncbi:MAG: cell wall hydrolase [Hyphomicrobiales bacterium]|nr:cell wall hydrolase [Hyphomicrobiales bacterium]